MTVAQKLRIYMAIHGIKHSYVAGKCGFQKAQFSAIMNGRRKLSADELVSVCENGLQIKPEVFFAIEFPEI